MSILTRADGPFVLWSPTATSADAVLFDTETGTTQIRRIPLHPSGNGWWISSEHAIEGQTYKFQITIDGDSGPGGHPVTVGPFPDPAAQRLPDGVHGASQVYAGPSQPTGWPSDPASGPLNTCMPDDQVIYEMHVGTFTPQGTFYAAIEKFNDLKELGVTCIEVMPIAPFGGTRNWGYDGVNWFGVQESYGGPDGFAEFVAQAHAVGLSVCLDVVYNHFGPDGFYGGAFAPYTRGGSTGWGEVVNFSGPDCDAVRAYAIASVRRWFEEFGVDALRLDAIHALVDTGSTHILEEFAACARSVSQATGRRRWLIAESDQNDPWVISTVGAQWNDDVHHAIHAAISGETQGYFCDFGSPEVLATVFERGFWHDGRFSRFRGRTHGRPLDLSTVNPRRLVVYTTTHDQTGNRAAGDRPSQNLTVPQLIAKAALVLTSPFTPMLFQGEEWGASTPFPFFCSHESEELNKATSKGRRAEFSRHGWDERHMAEPAEESTFLSAKLRWQERELQPHVEIATAYRRLLELRAALAADIPRRFDQVSAVWRSDKLADQEVVRGGLSTPLHPTPPSTAHRACEGTGRWVRITYPTYEVVVNLSGRAAEVPLTATGPVLFGSHGPVTLGDTRVRLRAWETLVIAA